MNDDLAVVEWFVVLIVHYHRVVYFGNDSDGNLLELGLSIHSVSC